MSLLPVTAFPRDLLPSLYLTNNIPITALQSDRRILYSAFIPDQHYLQSPDDACATKLPLLVAIHGTSRTQRRHVDSWRAFAIKYRCAIVAPVFPCLLAGPGDLDGYHYLGRPPTLSTTSSAKYNKILDSAVKLPSRVTVVEMEKNAEDVDMRYDLSLLSLLDEIAIRWPSIDTTRVFLTGFSGGAQFVHRFLCLHPERL